MLFFSSTKIFEASETNSVDLDQTAPRDAKLWFSRAQTRLEEAEMPDVWRLLQ